MTSLHLAGRTEGRISLDAIKAARIVLDEHPNKPEFRLAVEPPDEWLLLELQSLGSMVDDPDSMINATRSMYELIKSLVHEDDWTKFSKAMREVPRSLPIMGPNPKAKRNRTEDDPDEVEIGRVAVSKNKMLLDLLRSIIPLYTARPT